MNNLGRFAIKAGLVTAILGGAIQYALLQNKQTTLYGSWEITKNYLLPPCKKTFTHRSDRDDLKIEPFIEALSGVYIDGRAVRIKFVRVIDDSCNGTVDGILVYTEENGDTIPTYNITRAKASQETFEKANEELRKTKQEMGIR